MFDTKCFQKYFYTKEKLPGVSTVMSKIVFFLPSPDYTPQKSQNCVVLRIALQVLRLSLRLCSAAMRSRDYRAQADNLLVIYGTLAKTK